MAKNINANPVKGKPTCKFFNRLKFQNTRKPQVKQNRREVAALE